MLAFIYFSSSCLLFALVWRGHEYRGTRLVFTAVSVALDFAAVLLAENKKLKAVLVAIPTLALALFHQLELSNIEKQKTSSILVNRQEEALQKRERHLQEDFLQDPTTALEQARFADKGFLLKSKRLEISASEMEASLVAEYPEIAYLVLNFPDNPRNKLKAYQKLRKADPRMEVPIDQILQILQDQIAYQDLADLFRREIKPLYVQLQNRVKDQGVLASEACEQILTILDTLYQVELSHPLAGLLNHMGTMAMSCSRPYQAFGLFYTALFLDKNHLPAYESLAYILWLDNKDERTAVEITDHGLGFCPEERDALDASFRRSMESYETVQRRTPVRAALLHRHIEKLRKKMERIRNPWSQFVQEMENRLKNDFAYFSALGRMNEQRARAYIVELNRSHPQDLNYQDTYGFVKMRFARNEEELDEARAFFNAASKNRKAGPEEMRLLGAHIQELVALRAELQGHASSSM
jgi:hypothetical protein